MKRDILIRLCWLGIIILLMGILISPLEILAATAVRSPLLQAEKIIVQPISGLITTEAGGKATFTVVLNSRPNATVIINLSSSDSTEGTVSPASLTFRSNNWSTVRTVTVTGLDDQVVDRDVSFQVITAPATSSDPNYNNYDAANVSVTNQDNDTAQITVNSTEGLTTTEAGGTATFTIVLSDQPNANVSIGLNSSDTSEANISPMQLTFTPTNWSTAQVVTVTGVDDQHDDGDQAFIIITGNASSADTAYGGLVVPDVSGININNDFAPVAMNDSFLTNAQPVNPLIIDPPGVLSNDTDSNNDTLNAIKKSNPVKGILDFKIDGSFVYTPSQDFTQVETDSFTYVANDGTLDSNLTTVEVTIDPIIPSIKWISPVPNGEIYEALDLSVRLETEITENYSIDQVNFYRWDAIMNAYVDIGIVKKSPYQWDLDTRTLNYKWNQIFARVRDGAGNISSRQFIWIYKDLLNQIFLPTITR